MKEVITCEEIGSSNNTYTRNNNTHTPAHT